jgi:synaptic vesicle membrane protein VAT-1
MRQIWITKAGAPEVLQVREAPDPDAGPGQVRIRVEAAGINFADLMARVGLYPDAPPLPCVVGYEVSGTVDQLGEGTSGFALGDRVFAMPRFGGYTDTLVIRAEQVFKVPEAMSFQEAAAFPVVYLTAYDMMLFTGNLRPRSRVLIHSAAGGVGARCHRAGQDARLHHLRHRLAVQARVPARAGLPAPHRLGRRLRGRGARRHGRGRARSDPRPGGR